MSTNILSTRDRLPHKEAARVYVDINFASNDDLGRRLSPIFGRKFITILGTIGSMRNLMEYVSRPGYPQELLEKTRLTTMEKETIPAAHVKISNYWAVVAYGLCERVKQDKELIKQLKENPYEFTSYSQKKTTVLFGKEVTIAAPNNGMRYYVAIVRFISDMIKTDAFTDKNITTFINKCKDARDLDIFDGVRMIEGSVRI